MSLFHLNSRITKWFVCSFIVLSLVLVSYGPIPKVEHAEAADVVTDPGNTAMNAASKAYNFIASAALKSLGLKEWTLDGVAFAAINIILKHMSRSIVTWINNGFQGSPAFISDFRGFLLDVADIQAGRFLTQLGLGIMCSPFRLDVQLALAIQYQRARNYESECRLSDVVANVDNFLNNNSFSDGGWDGWFALTTEPRNNPYGSLVQGQFHMSARIVNARGEKIEMSKWGEGFLSFEHCDYPTDTLSVEPVCHITTPGAIIEDQLNKTLDTGRHRLIIADEINEILGALFAQLVKQVFTGAGGLLGLTQGGYSGRSGFSYVEAATSPDQDSVGYSNNSQNPIGQSIQDEIRYRDLQFRAIDLIDEAEAYIPSIAISASSTCADIPLPNTLANARDDAYDQIVVSDSTIAILQSLRDRYNATNDPDEHLAVMDEYQALQSADLLHTEVDSVEFEFEVIGNQYVGTIIPSVNQYKAQKDQTCQNLLLGP